MKYIAIIFLFVLAGVMIYLNDRSPVPPITPTPNPTFSANTLVDCADQLVLSLRQVTLHHLNMEAATQTNDLKAFIFMTDGNVLSQFNYNVFPIPTVSEQRVDFDRFHTAIELNDANEIYAWIVIVDDQHFSQTGELTSDFLNSVASFLIGNAFSPGAGGFFASLGTDLAGNQITNWLQQDNIIGDIAFKMSIKNDWLQGVHFPTTPNNAVDLIFSIQPYSCSTAVVAFPRLDDSGTPPDEPIRPVLIDQRQLLQCGSNAPRTNLQIGDMAIVSVPNNIFFRNAPDLDAPGIRYARGHMVRIVEGAVCDGNIMYWRVLDWQGRSGWMAESRIEPDTGLGVYLLSVVSAMT